MECKLLGTEWLCYSQLRKECRLGQTNSWFKQLVLIKFYLIRKWLDSDIYCHLSAGDFSPHSSIGTELSGAPTVFHNLTTAAGQPLAKKTKNKVDGYSIIITDYLTRYIQKMS